MDQEQGFQNKYYEEINLADYVKVILKRKGLILSFCFGAAIAAGILSFLIMPKVYKVEAVLEVGIIGEEVVEPPDQVIGEIKSDIYKNPIEANLGIPYLKFPKIKLTNPVATNLVKMEIDSEEPQIAKNILEEMISLVLEDQEKKVQNRKEILEADIKLFEGNIEISKKDMERIQSKIGILEIEKKNLEEKEKALEQLLPYQQMDEQLRGSLFLLLDIKEKLSKKEKEIYDSYSQKNSIEIEINSQKSEINLLRDKINNIQLPKVMKTPTISNGSISPRPLLNIVIFAMLGLFLGVILAFAKEWLQKEGIKT